MIAIQKTSDVTLQHIKSVVYGNSGVGKTTLSKTVESPIVLSMESGLLSLQDSDIDYVEIKTIEALREAFGAIKPLVMQGTYKTVILDSLSELAEIVLAHEKGQNKDGRQAYMQMQDKIDVVLRSFRDLPCDVVLIAHCEQKQDDTGRMLYTASMPGKNLSKDLPYFFDLVLAMRSEKNEKGELKRFLQTYSDVQYIAKDRSGKLNPLEAPDLGSIFAKIRSPKAQ